MNRDVEENELKQLFRELRREDERLAPPFARDWGAALSRTDTPLSRMNERRSPRRTFRLAAATLVALILLGAFALILFTRSSRQPTLTATAESAETRTQPRSPSVAPIETPTSLVEDSSEIGRNQVAKADSKTSGPDSKLGSARERSKSARRRLSAQSRLMSARSQTTVASISRTTVALISRWRSPTEFLLKSPGEQLLKTVPRLNESLLDIKAVTPDVNN